MKKQSGVQASLKNDSEIHNEYLALVGHVVRGENLLLGETWRKMTENSH